VSRKTERKTERLTCFGGFFAKNSAGASAEKAKALGVSVETRVLSRTRTVSAEEWVARPRGPGVSEVRRFEKRVGASADRSYCRRVSATRRVLSRTCRMASVERP